MRSEIFAPKVCPGGVFNRYPAKQDDAAPNPTIVAGPHSADGAACAMLRLLPALWLINRRACQALRARTKFGPAAQNRLVFRRNVRSCAGLVLRWELNRAQVIRGASCDARPTLLGLTRLRPAAALAMRGGAGLSSWHLG